MAMGVRLLAPLSHCRPKPCNCKVQLAAGLQGLDYNILVCQHLLVMVASQRSLQNGQLSVLLVPEITHIVQDKL